MRSLVALFLFALFAAAPLRAAADDGSAIVVVPDADIPTPEGFDPYVTLGLPTHASRAEIRKAYKAAGVEKGEAVELAFKILGNAASKERWDAGHGLKGMGDL